MSTGLIKSFFKYAPIAGPVLLILFSIYCRLRLMDVPLERDEGEYAYVGQQLIRGVLPIVSIHHLKLPGIYIAYAFIELMFGETYQGIHSGLSVINILTSICIYFIGKRIFNSTSALVGSAVFSVMSLSQSFQGFTANAEHFVILFAMLGIYFFLRAFPISANFSLKNWQQSTSSPSVTLLLSGLFLGIGYTLKQHAIFFVAFVGIFFLYNCVRIKNIKFTIVNGLFLLTGLIIPLGSICVLYFSLGYFDEFWWWTSYYPRTYAGLIPWRVGKSNFLNSFTLILDVFWPIFCFSILGFIGVLGSKRWKIVFFCLTLLGLSALAACVGFSFYPHYFLYIIPAISLMCVGGVHTLSMLMAKTRLAFLGNTVGAFTVLLLLLISVKEERRYLLYADGEEILRETYGSHPFPESVIIGNYIKQHTKPDDIIVVYGSEPQIYFYANRKSATGFIYTYEMIGNHPFVHQFQLQMAKEIDASKPKFFIDIKMLGSWWAGRPVKEDNYIHEWTDRYKKNNYREVGLVENGILQAGNFIHTPRTDHYIKIYERIK